MSDEDGAKPNEFESKQEKKTYEEWMLAWVEKGSEE